MHVRMRIRVGGKHHSGDNSQPAANQRARTHLEARHVVAAGVVGGRLGGAPLGGAHACSSGRVCVRVRVERGDSGSGCTTLAPPLPAAAPAERGHPRRRLPVLFAHPPRRGALAAPLCCSPARRPPRTPAGTGGSEGRWATLTVVVVFADKDAGQVPQCSHVESLENLALQANGGAKCQ